MTNGTSRKVGRDLYRDPAVVKLVKESPMLDGPGKLFYMHVRDAIESASLELPP